MEYKVLIEFGNSLMEAKWELEKQVEKLLKEGWNLYGGVSIAVSTKYGRQEYYLTQAMTK